MLLESNNYVVAAEVPEHADLVGRRLLRVRRAPDAVVTTGPVFPRRRPRLPSPPQNNPNAVSFMEWSNSLARIAPETGPRGRL